MARQICHQRQAMKPDHGKGLLDGQAVLFTVGEGDAVDCGLP